MANARTKETPRLALLVAAPWQGNTMMHNDLMAMYDALRHRGFLPEQILSIEGTLNQGLLMAFLREARGRFALWNHGEVFFHYSGHGTFTGTNELEARPALWLQDTQNLDGHRVFWDEVFSTLDLPVNIELTLLPDC